MKKIIILLILLVSFTSILECKKHEGKVTIGTFNIEWLGDGTNDNKPRNEEGYKAIAELINEIEPDVLGLQEIENQDALDKVLNYLKGYKGKVLTSGGEQNLGVIYHKDVKINSFSEYTQLAVEYKKTRSGIVLDCKKDNFDWKMMIVHLKSSSFFDKTKEKRESSIEIRGRQGNILNKWIDSVLKYSSEKDLIIVGDFNDNPNNSDSKTLKAISNNKKVKFITESLTSCFNPKWKVIDNILLSKSALKRCKIESLRMYNPKKIFSRNISKNISDHCPIIVDFETLETDND